MKRYYAILVNLIIFSAISISINAETLKIALVIGNQNYQDAPLSKTINDANDIATILKSFGFQVILKTDLNQREMVEAIQKFGQQLQNESIGVFYFSGHGLQSENLNYLVPLEANIKSEADIKFETVPAERVFSQMQLKNDLGVNLVILDACRNNPYKGYLKGIKKGLAQMDPPIGGLIAYATAPNTAAYESEGRNSIFTKHLLKTLHTEPSLPITELFIEVTNAVSEETNRRQIPWQLLSLTQHFRFVEPDSTSEVQNQEEIKRIKCSALVIGNTNYEDAPLNAPKNNAYFMAAILENLGFDVNLQLDTNSKKMQKSLRDFVSQRRLADVNLFYFSGYNIQDKEKSYLLPVDKLSRFDLAYEAPNIKSILEQIKQKSQGNNIIILDVWNSALYQGTKGYSPLDWSKIESKLNSIVIAFNNTERNRTEDEVTDYSASIFTRHLINVLRDMPDLSVSELFTEVTRNIAKETNGQQIPWHSVFLTERFSLSQCDRDKHQ